MSPVPAQKLEAAFFRRPAQELAPALLGKVLVRRWRGLLRYARIVETEAYIGIHDLASHASKGRTRRTEVMFGPGGHAYVYLIYGVYAMLNVVAGQEEDPQAVLLRAAEPLDGWQADLSGPGKLTRGLHITCAENDLDLTGDKLFFLEDPAYRPHVVMARRIGIDYAGDEWRNALLRFGDRNSTALSKPL